MANDTPKGNPFRTGRTTAALIRELSERGLEHARKMQRETEHKAKLDGKLEAKPAEAAIAEAAEPASAAAAPIAVKPARDAV